MTDEERFYLRNEEEAKAWDLARSAAIIRYGDLNGLANQAAQKAIETRRKLMAPQESTQRKTISEKARKAAFRIGTHRMMAAVEGGCSPETAAELIDILTDRAKEEG